MKDIKTQVKQKNKTSARKIEILCSTSGLLLSVVCCIALIHVEWKIQEHHRLISHSTVSCEQLKTEILQKAQSKGRKDDKDNHSKGHAARGLYFDFSWFAVKRSCSTTVTNFFLQRFGLVWFRAINVVILKG